MNYSNALNYVLSELEQTRKTNADHLARGGAVDYANYQKLCGVIQGLDTASNIIKDLAKRMEDDDE